MAATARERRDRIRLTGRLVRRPSATTPRDRLRRRAAHAPGVAEQRGVYLHRAVTPNPDSVKKQIAWMLEVQCPADEDTVRMTRQWLDELGTPTCPCGSCMAGRLRSTQRGTTPRPLHQIRQGRRPADESDSGRTRPQGSSSQYFFRAGIA